MANDEVMDTQKFFREHPLLFELIGKNGVLFECDGEAPSPSKDYGQLQINLNQVNYEIKVFFLKGII